MFRDSLSAIFKDQKKYYNYNNNNNNNKSQWPSLAKELRASLGLLAIPVFDHFGGVNGHLVLNWVFCLC